MKHLITAATAAIVLAFASVAALACTPTQPCDGMDPIGKGKGAVPRIGGDPTPSARNPNDGGSPEPRDGIDQFIDTASDALREVDAGSPWVNYEKRLEEHVMREAQRSRDRRRKTKHDADDAKFIQEFLK